MDTFLIMVVAGCVGALVGAIAAFYLGGVREKHKRILASQGEEQRRLQEWRRKEQSRIEENKEREHQREEERNQRLIDRRAEALDDIRIQALYFANAFLRSWTDRAANLEVPPKAGAEQVVGFSEGLAELLQQADEVSTRLVFLRGHYNAHSPILEEKSRKIIEPLEEQGMERHSLLSNQLKATAALLHAFLVLLQPQLVNVIDPTSHSDVISRLAGSGLGTSVSPETFSRVKELWDVHKNKEAILEEHRREVLQAANVARDWDIQMHLRALDAEIGRIESISSWARQPFRT